MLPNHRTISFLFLSSFAYSPDWVGTLIHAIFGLSQLLLELLDPGPERLDLPLAGLGLPLPMGQLLGLLGQALSQPGVVVPELQVVGARALQLGLQAGQLSVGLEAKIGVIIQMNIS